MRVLTVLGTRPEAIKLAPVVLALLATAGVEHVLFATGQHREMLGQALDAFGLRPDHDLAVMTPGQDLLRMAGAVMEGLGQAIDSVRPDWVIVQGDTTTCFAASLAACYRRVPVAHIEAGLRSGAIHTPWPEEANRRLTGQIASLHFAPTPAAARNLRAEGVDEERILVTGNTVIDALLMMRDRLERDAALRAELDRRFAWRDRSRRLVLVTGHRRESLDGGLERVCRGLARIARRGDVQIVCPVHPNPAVRRAVGAALGGTPAVELIAPVDYPPFVHLMREAHLIVTDSGGVQEEAPSLGKPVLVTRDTTERPEALAAGTARLVGTDEDRLVEAMTQLLDDADAYGAMARAANPYGDGRAAGRIVARLIGEG